MRGAALGAILLGCISLQAVLCASGDASFFAARRQALMQRIEGSVAVLQGAAGTRAYTRFRQDNNFYYLTGVEEPDALLLLDATQHRSILFLPAPKEDAELVEGLRLFPGPDARKATGIDEVLDLSRFRDEMEKRKKTFQFLFTPSSPYETAATSRDLALKHDAAQQRDAWDGRLSREAAFEKNLKEKLGRSVRIRDLAPILDAMRRIKDAQEIERLREAGRIGALGLKEAMRSAAPGMYEYQLAALAEYLFLWHGASGPAFSPLVGSGPNARLWHYSLNHRKMEPGDLVVMDFGADYRYYQSDIARTFPVSGRFSEEQAKIYQAVLHAQKAVLAKVRPGATFEALEEAARGALKPFGYDTPMPHRVSHYVGMSSHDPGEDEPFAAGVVLAVEPGVYLPDKNLGIRIEDTVLVTGEGCEILSADVPKEIAEIEKLMAERGSR